MREIRNDSSGQLPGQQRGRLADDRAAGGTQRAQRGGPGGTVQRGAAVQRRRQREGTGGDRRRRQGVLRRRRPQGDGGNLTGDPAARLRASVRPQYRHRQARHRGRQWHRLGGRLPADAVLRSVHRRGQRDVRDYRGQGRPGRTMGRAAVVADAAAHRAADPADRRPDHRAASLRARAGQRGRAGRVAARAHAGAGRADRRQCPAVGTGSQAHGLPVQAGCLRGGGAHLGSGLSQRRCAGRASRLPRQAAASLDRPLMPVDMAALLADLQAESAALDAILAPLRPEQYLLPTPAAGWCVADQVSHLAFFDEAALLAAVDPGQFRVEAAEMIALGPGFPDEVAARYRTVPGTELRDWLLRARRALLDGFATIEPSRRLPWYGPEMSAASSVTARLMETWAHGQDVADALGVSRPATARLRHIAHIGVSTIGFNFALHGLAAPGPGRPPAGTAAAPENAADTGRESAT